MLVLIGKHKDCYLNIKTMIIHVSAYLVYVVVFIYNYIDFYVVMKHKVYISFSSNQYQNFSINTERYGLVLRVL